MQFTLATIALVASAQFAAAQGVTALLTPTASAPAGCKTDYAGSFEITVVKPAVAKRNIEKRACAATGTAVLTLAGSVLTDAFGRIGSIVANHQFQFDGPPAQAGAIYTGGFSVCGNGSLALGGSNIFYQCKSGDFYNLYDNPDNGALCQPILIDIMPCGSVGQAADGQPTAGSATAAATQISDGQIQASSANTAAAVTQIGDGQVQASSAVTAPAVTQIGDGQLQATSAVAPNPVTQISDGQIQVQPTPPAAPVVQISDGQVQATTAAAASATGAPVSQISDGQIQATSAGSTTLKTTAAPVSQIPDGQVQAGSATTPAAASTSTTAVFTGGAAAQTGSWVAAVVFAGAVALL